MVADTNDVKPTDQDTPYNPHKTEAALRGLNNNRRLGWEAARNRIGGQQSVHGTGGKLVRVADVVPRFDFARCTTEHVWDRQPDEPTLWYDRFTHFLLMGPGKHSLPQTQRDCSNLKAHGVTQPWLLAATSWKWKQRAEAYDVWLAEEERREFEQARKESRKRRIRIANNIADSIEGALEHIKFEKLNGKDFAEVVRIVFNELRTDFNDQPTQRLAMIRVQAAREVAEELGIDVSEVLDSFDEEAMRPRNQQPGSQQGNEQAGNEPGSQPGNRQGSQNDPINRADIVEAEYTKAE